MNIKTEKWNGHEIRFVWHNGEWWAVAKDVAKALGYSHTPSMVRMLRDNQKSSVHLAHRTSEKGGNPNVLQKVLQLRRRLRCRSSSGLRRSRSHQRFAGRSTASFGRK